MKKPADPPTAPGRGTVLVLALLAATAGHVSASETSRHEALEARELWRIGGADDERFFGAIARAFSDDAGNLYFVDSQLSEMQVYAATGEYLRTLSREGDGPGEVRRPLDGCWLPDGTLGLLQPFPGSVVRLQTDGTPGGCIRFGAGEGGFVTLVRAWGRGGVFALAGIKITYGQDGRGTETRFLSLCGIDGTEHHALISRLTPVDYNHYTLDEGAQDFISERCDLGPAGQLYVAPDRNAYRIEVYSPEGELLRTIHREYRSLRRDETLRQAARRRLEAYGRYIPNVKPGITIAETEPDITGLRVTTDGRIWVRTSRGDDQTAPGCLTSFDLFTREGHFRRTVALRCPGSLKYDQVFLLSAERLIRVVGGVSATWAHLGAGAPAGDGGEGENPLEIVCYDISE